MKKLTQQEFWENIISENVKKSKATKEDEEKALDALYEIKDDISFSLEEINKKAVENTIYFYGNIFPKFYTFEEDDVIWIKNGDLYRTKEKEYEHSISYILNAISKYIKFPLLHCNELNSLFVKFFFYLKMGLLANHYGYKGWGWRYQFWGRCIGKWGLYIGLITSGFILFPILIALGFYHPLEKIFNIPIYYISIIAGFLLSYKIIKLIVDIICHKLGHKNKIEKEIEPYEQIRKYLFNDIIQPQKLIELASKIDDLPASINILISYMNNEENIAYNNCDEFLKLYMDKEEDDESDDTEE